MTSSPKEKFNFLATIKVGGWTFASRVAGLIRDIFTTNLLGASVFHDIFVVVLKIPNVFRRFFAEGAFSQAFIPIYSDYLGKDNEGEGQEFINALAGLLLTVLFTFTVLALIFAPFFILIFAPGFYFDSAKQELAVNLLRIMFPYLGLISLVAFASGIQNSHQKFSIPAATPLIFNFSLILAASMIAPKMEIPVMALAWGVLLAGILQLLFQIAPLAAIKKIPIPKLDFSNKGQRKFLVLIAPAILAGGIAQINLLVDTIFASLLITGSPTWLYVSDRLIQFPLGIFAIAIGTVLLPSLSKSYSGKDQKEYSGLLDWGLRLTFIFAAPAAVALAVLSLPLIATLFHYGAFNTHDVLMTQQATIAYSFGLMGLIMIKVLAPGFYARQNIKTPVKIALFTLFSTQLMNMLFIGQFKHAGLALAIGLGACLNASLLYYHLRKGRYYKPHDGWAQFLIKLFIALVLMGLTLFYLKGDSLLWLEYSISKRLIYLIMLILAGSVVYFGSLWMMGLRLQSFIRRAI